jgi:hypothetical protein
MACGFNFSCNVASHTFGHFGCRQHATEAIAAADYAEARLALSDYRAWRSRGGFEPTDGDDRADELERILLQSHAAPTKA